MRWCGKGRVEVACEVDEVGDGDLTIEIQIAFAPAAGGVEVGGEVDVVRDGDGFVEVEVAQDGVADEDGIEVNGLAIEGGIGGSAGAVEHVTDSAGGGVGGGHENERRAGTENLAGIIGFTESLERFIKSPVFSRSHLQPLTERLIKLIQSTEGAQIVGSLKNRLVNTVSFVVDGSDSIALLAGLDMEGICASSGSACSAGSLEPSHVISALGVEKRFAHSLVRFSLGRDSTAEEVDRVEQILPEVISRTRK